MVEPGMGAELLKLVRGAHRGYYEQRGKTAELEEKQAASGCVYVGNLSFYTREEQVWEVFSKCGPVKRIIMGLNRNDMTPCGFCFVEFHEHEAAVMASQYLTGSRLDDRLIRVELDVPFEDGRQWGRGKSGGQVRDEFREQFDAGRGGFGPRSQAAAMPATEVFSSQTQREELPGDPPPEALATGGETRLGPYDAGAGPYDASAGPYDASAGPYDAAPGPYDGGPSPYDAGAGPYETGPYDSGPYQTEESAEPTQKRARIDGQPYS